ncbi:MAG: division/cell wall cluster transcriptional repressor MraZ [Pseudomonadota bacterium]
MFRGPDSLTVDAKGRMPIPTRHREHIAELCGGQLIVTCDRDRCLLIYPEPTWLEVEARINAMPRANAFARNMQRMLVGNAMPVEMDSAHRILIKPMHRDYARIDRKVVLIGQDNKFELWDDAVYQKKLGDWGIPEGGTEAAPADESMATFQW